MAINDDNQIKGIDELIKETRKKAVKPILSSTEKKDAAKKGEVTLRTSKTEEEFEVKMEEIKIKELEKEAEIQAKTLGVPYINLVGFPIVSDALTSIPKKIAEQEQVVCFYADEKEVRVASPNPNNLNLQPIVEGLIEELTFGSGKSMIYLCTQHSLNTALKLYERYPEKREYKPGIEITGDELRGLQKELKNFGLLSAKLNEEKNITRMVSMLIAGAMKSNASDIHLEAEENEIVARYRIDGVLHIVGKLPKKMWRRLDSRIKTIAKLKINVTNTPQDGRITVYLSEGDKLEIRVSTLPTSYGESIVMRLLASTAAALKFEDLGLRGKAYEDLKEQSERPTGMVVTTGPTGSGKTTTMYAILNKLNNEKTKIITLEDPIEYKLPGISQSQIDHSKGYTFAEGLRSILRQDPDVIMVGELRDLETSEVAIQAALTGHKVLSTVHTNDAAGAIPRFLSMKVKPFLLAPALNAVIGQRLVRKICEACIEEKKLEPSELEKVKDILKDLPDSEKLKIDLDNLKFYRGGGCEACNHIGYKGRIGIYEIFIMSEGINNEILGGKTDEYKILRLAKKGGMITMAQDGILKALDKITSVEEVFRVSEVEQGATEKKAE